MNFNIVPLPIGKIQLFYLELWNPRMQELNNLEKHLQNNRMICVVWLYGDVDQMEDYSSLNSSRITVPFWLGKNLKQAAINYPIVKKQLYPELDEYIKIEYSEVIK